MYIDDHSLSMIDFVAWLSLMLGEGGCLLCFSRFSAHLLLVSHAHTMCTLLHLCLGIFDIFMLFAYKKTGNLEIMEFTLNKKWLPNKLKMGEATLPC